MYRAMDPVNDTDRSVGLKATKGAVMSTPEEKIAYNCIYNLFQWMFVVQNSIFLDRNLVL